jgi:hypothetical protein
MEIRRGGRDAMAFREELQTERDIDATPDRVWEVLTRFEDFGSWNPFIVSIEGATDVGARLRVRLEPPGGRGVTLRPTVTMSEPNRVFAWLGRFGIPGLFDGSHRFDLEARPDGGTRFIQSEHFHGALVPLLRRSLRTKTLAGFEAMNRALEERAEAAV